MKMIELRSDICKDVLLRYTKAIVHMRQQYTRKQFGLVFGAGIGNDINFPKWGDLLGRIAAHPKVDGLKIQKHISNATSLAQQLFEAYRTREVKALAMPEDGSSRLLEMTIRAGWREIVHECLYRGLPASVEELLENDRYLEAFVPIIKNTHLTVTYNFDDTLERLLHKHRNQDTSQLKGYKTYWSGNVQLHPRSGAIYHPNGFLPFKLIERPSDHLVFSEDSFADQLIDSMAGHYGSLATHFSQTTCLLVGLSLDDPTLKHLLRQTANSFPGHFHYYVSFVVDAAKRDECCEEVQARANFDVYNLNTLYLTADEIHALAVLVAAKDEDFKAFSEEVVEFRSFKFFVVGSVGAGKSTTVNQFRSMLTQDEWTEERMPGMEKAPDLLTPDEVERIDAWVADQVSKKNIHLIESTQKGFHIIDRAPLDALAFTPKDAWPAKAHRLLGAVAPGKIAGVRRLVSGHVIFLCGDPDVMAERAVSLHKKTSAEKLKLQQEELLRIYEKLMPKTGFSKVDTRRKSVQEVVKEVAKIIFQDSYSEADLHERLLQAERKGYEE